MLALAHEFRVGACTGRPGRGAVSAHRARTNPPSFGWLVRLTKSRWWAGELESWRVGRSNDRSWTFGAGQSEIRRAPQSGPNRGCAPRPAASRRSSRTCRLRRTRRMVSRIRCAWSFRHRSPGKDWHFPFKLPKNGADISKHIARISDGLARHLYYHVGSPMGGGCGRRGARTSAASRPASPSSALASRRSRTSARAGNRRFGLLSGFCAHTKAPYKIDLLWRTRRVRNRPGRDDLLLDEGAGVGLRAFAAPPRLLF